MATNSNVFGAFPELKVEKEEISGGWRNFKEEFLIAAELNQTELGVHDCNDRGQLLASCTAVE